MKSVIYYGQLISQPYLTVKWLSKLWANNFLKMTENLTIKGLIPVAEVRYKVMDYSRYIYLYIQCMQKIIL